MILFLLFLMAPVPIPSAYAAWDSLGGGGGITQGSNAVLPGSSLFPFMRIDISDNSQDDGALFLYGITFTVSSPDFNITRDDIAAIALAQGGGDGYGLGAPIIAYQPVGKSADKEFAPSIFQVTVMLRGLDGQPEPLIIENVSDPEAARGPASVNLYALARTNRTIDPGDNFRIYLSGPSAIFGYYESDEGNIGALGGDLEFSEAPLGQNTNSAGYFADFRSTLWQGEPDPFIGAFGPDGSVVWTVSGGAANLMGPNLQARTFFDTVHFDARVLLGGFRIPEVIAHNAPHKGILRISMAGGYNTPDDNPGENFFPGYGQLFTLRALVTSTGRQEEWLADGVDNDLDQFFMENNEVDDDLDGVIDNVGEGVDESDLGFHSFQNIDDDNHVLFVDQVIEDGVFQPTRDRLVNDVGGVRFILDATDTVAGQRDVYVMDDEDFEQVVGVNDDEDWWANDAAAGFNPLSSVGNPGVGLMPDLTIEIGRQPCTSCETPFATIPPNVEHFNHWVDSIFLDDGDVEKVWDPEDTILTPGTRLYQNVLGEPYPFAANNDMDFFIPSPIDRVESATGAFIHLNAGFDPLTGNPVPYYLGVDEVWLDAGVVPGELDPGDVALYLGPNGVPDNLFPAEAIADVTSVTGLLALEIPTTYGFRLYNDDRDFWRDPQLEDFVDEDRIGRFNPGDEVWILINGRFFPTSPAAQAWAAENNDDGDENGIPDAWPTPDELLGLNPLIDEEFRNGMDDDGDGFIDEDVNSVLLYALIDEDDTTGDVDAGNQIDDDKDGRTDEDGFGPSPDIVFRELRDEESQDGVDEDGDGLVDEDVDYIPLGIMVDEETVDYYVNGEGGTALFESGIDDYYFDLNNNGLFDDGFNDNIEFNVSELISAGADGVADLVEGQPYASPEVIPLDNDGDGELNEQGLPLPDGIDNDPVYHRYSNFLEGFVDWGEGWDGRDNDGDGQIDEDDEKPFIVQNSVDDDGDGRTDEDDEALAILNDRIDNDFDGITDEDDERFLQIDEGYNEDVGDAALDLNLRYNTGVDGVPVVFYLWEETGESAFEDQVGGFNPVTDRLLDVAFGSPTSGIGGSHTPQYVATFTGLVDPPVFIDPDGVTFYISAYTRGVGPYGQTFSVSLPENGFTLSTQSFALSEDYFVPPGVALQDFGRPRINLLGYDNTLGLYMQDVIGTNSVLEDARLTSLASGIGATEALDLGPYNARLPFIDATSGPVPLIGINMADSPNFNNSGGFDDHLQTIEAVRVNFMDVDLAGEGVWTPSDLSPLADDEFSGLTFYMDDSTVAGNNADDDGDGLVDEEVRDYEDNDGDGLFDEDLGDGDIESYNGSFDTLDDLIPVNFNAGTGNNGWNPDPSDPLVQDRDGDGRPDAYYAILAPVDGVSIPPDDDLEYQTEPPQFLGRPGVQLRENGVNEDYDWACPGDPDSNICGREMVDEWVNAGHDFFVVVRAGEDIDYNDAFRAFIRDGDLRTRNEHNVVNSGVKVDPVAANVPTILRDETDSIIPPGDDFASITANSPSTSVLSIDLHDSNNTFETENGSEPSRLSRVWLDFLNVPSAVSVSPTQTVNLPDEDFTQTDLAPLLPVERQWVNIVNAAAGIYAPWEPGVPNQRIGSVNGVALYRDDPNSDNNGVFDDPFDPGVVNPDTPVMLAGDEEWDYTHSRYLTLRLNLDPPKTGPNGEDVSTPYDVDPVDPDPYEMLPPSETGPVTQNAPQGLYFGPDYFVVIRTSDTISYGDDFQVRLASTADSFLHYPLTFYPPLSNSYRHPFPQTLSTPVTRFSFEHFGGLTNTIRVPEISITSMHDLVAKPGGSDSFQDATSPPVPVFGLNVTDAPGVDERIVAFRLDVESVKGFEQKDLRPLTSIPNVSPPGITLIQDATGAGNGVYSANDVELPIVNALWLSNYFADHPGPDGLLGTSDDPGTPGVFDPGLDELYLDNPPLGYLDPNDELVDDGDNDRRDVLLSSVPLGATIPLTLVPERLSARVFLVDPVPIPDGDTGDNASMDFFVAVRTSEQITYLDEFRFYLAKDAVRFTSGRSLANQDGVTNSVISKVPTFLEDPTDPDFPGFNADYNGAITNVQEPFPVLAMHFVSDARDANGNLIPEYLKSVRLIFENEGDFDFTLEDLAGINSVDPSITGIGVWADGDINGQDKNGEFNPDQDTFIPLLGGEDIGWRRINLPPNPYPRFALELTLDPNHPRVRLPSERPLERSDRRADYFVAVRASNVAGTEDDFIVSVPEEGVRFRTARPSGETVTGIEQSLVVNQAPRLSFVVPEAGDLVDSESQTVFTIDYEAFDPDSNAEINLWYYPESTPSATAFFQSPAGTLSQTIFEDDGDRDFPWAVNVLPEGIYGVRGSISDDETTVFADGGRVRVINADPKIRVLTPATDTNLFADRYTIRWDDSDVDNNARISLYLSELPLSATMGIPPFDAVPAGAILVATGIDEDPDGAGSDQFELNIGSLVRSGSLQLEVPYYVLGAITDDISGNTGMIASSTGTILRRAFPSIRVVDPGVNTSVNEFFDITFETTAADPETSEVTLALRLSNRIGDTIYTNAQSIVPATRPLSATTFLVQGVRLADLPTVPGRPNLYRYTLRTTMTVGDEIMLDDSFFARLQGERDFYVYAEISDASRDRAANFSNGILRFNRHFIRVTRPPAGGEQASLEDGIFPIMWQAQSDDPNARVSLFYDTNRQDLDGQEVVDALGFPAQRLPVDFGTPDGTFNWNFRGIQLGSYYIYAVLLDNFDDFGLFADYSDGPVNVGEIGKGVMALDNTGDVWTTDSYVLNDTPAGSGEYVSTKLSPSGMEGYYALREDFSLESLDDAAELFYVVDGALSPTPASTDGAPVDLEIFEGDAGVTVGLILKDNGDVLVAGTSTAAALPEGATQVNLQTVGAQDLEVFEGGTGYAILTRDGQIIVQGDLPAGLEAYAFTMDVGGLFITMLESPVSGQTALAQDLEVKEQGDGYAILLADGRFYPVGDVPAFDLPFFGTDTARDMLLFERVDNLTGDIRVAGLVLLDKFGTLFSVGDAPLGPLRDAGGEPLLLPGDTVAAADLEPIEFDTFITTSELEFAGLPLSNDQYADPAVSGSLIAYVSGTGNTTDLMLAEVEFTETDIQVLEVRPVSEAMSYQTQPALDGDRGVYTSRETLVEDDVFLFTINPNGSITTTNLTATLSSNHLQPDISHDIVVWSGFDTEEGDFDIYAVDLNAPQDIMVLTENDGGANQYSPKVFQYASGMRAGQWRVVWEDDRNGTLDVFLYDSTQPDEIIALATGPGNQSQPDIYGEMVAYTNSFNPTTPGDKDILLVDLFKVGPSFPDDSNRRVLSDDPFSQEKPSMTAERTVWVDRSLRNLFDIFAFDSNVGVIQMTNGFLLVESLDADGNNIVWVERRDNQFQLWGGHVSLELTKPKGTRQ